MDFDAPGLRDLNNTAGIEVAGSNLDFPKIIAD
jgi:hypothetical protein